MWVGIRIRTSIRTVRRCWIGCVHQTREYVVLLLSSLDLMPGHPVERPISDSVGLSRRQRRAMVRQMAKWTRAEAPTCTVTTELPADPPDDVRVILDLKGTWSPPPHKGWRKERETVSPEGQERGTLWVRNGEITGRDAAPREER
jgi:hypothetical protein